MDPSLGTIGMFYLTRVEAYIINREEQIVFKTSPCTAAMKGISSTHLTPHEPSRPPSAFS